MSSRPKKPRRTIEMTAQLRDAAHAEPHTNADETTAVDDGGDRACERGAERRDETV